MSAIDHTTALLTKESQNDFVKPVQKGKGGLGLMLVVEVTLVLMWVLMGEIAQAFPNLTHDASVFSGVTSASYVLLLLPWAASRYFGSGWPDAKAMAKLFNFMIALGLMWVLQIWFWYMSLEGMSVSVNTIIYQTTPLSVYFIDIYLHGPTPSHWTKLSCIVLAVTGVAVMSLSDTKQDGGMENSTTACIQVIIATLLYAVFDVMYAEWAAPMCDKMVEESNKGGCPILSPGTEQVLLLLGLRAVPACVFLGATLLVQGVEGELPLYSTADYWAMFAVTVADWAFNVAMCVGLTVFSPLWVTMGTIVCVPTALVFDMVVHNLSLSFGAWMGCVATAIGFVTFNVVAARETPVKHH